MSIFEIFAGDFTVLRSALDESPRNWQWSEY